MGTLAAESASMLRADGTFNEPNVTAIYLLINVVVLSNIATKSKIKNQLLLLSIYSYHSPL
jgi:hypothetical protein